MTSLPDSPVARVLGVILQGLYPDRTQLGAGERINPQDNTEFLVVSYRRDFSALWDINEDFLAWLTSAPKTIVLVWDETPSEDLGDVALSEYVTACDWAVALCLLADRYAIANDREPEWELFVADLASHKHPSAPGVRLFSALQRGTDRLIPWVQLFPVEDLPTLLDLLVTRPQVHPRTVDVDIMRSTWAAILVNPATASERHAIVNLVAPRVLLAGMVNEKGKAPLLPLIRALDLMMRAVGLLPEASQRLPGPWVRFLRWKNVVKQFVLIDDMADFGWEAFLRSALGAGGSQLEVYTDPKEWRSVCNQEKIILFLDLRLFGRRPGDEAAFFAQLLQSASQFKIEDDEPADSGFYRNELAALERAIKTGIKDNSDYYTALTVLPRLMSLTDPTLPIVMFSSTGRKEIAEALRPFGNVILGFDKPRFFGDTSDTVLAETRQKFEVAMQDALILAEGRDLCRKLRTQPPVAVRDGMKGRTVEIFLDESRSEDNSRFAVGGLVLVHPPNGSPNQLDADLRSEGLVWTKSAGGAVGGQTLPKQPANYAPYLTRLQEFLDIRGIEICAFGLVRSGRLTGSQPRSLLLREGSLDLQNFDMVTDVVEATLFDVIDGFAPEPSKVCAHLATRVHPVDRSLDADQAVEDWGLGLAPWNSRMHYSVTVKDGRQITRMAMRRRASKSWKLPVEQARAVSLDKTTTPPRAREIHHLADWLARFARMPYQDVPDIAKGWFSQGFLNEDDEALSYWLKAARAGDEGRWVEALHCAYQARAYETYLYIEGSHQQRAQDKALSYSKFVRRKASQWPSEVGPSEFSDLCGRLRTHPGYTVLRVDHIEGGGFNPSKKELYQLFGRFGHVSNVRTVRPTTGEAYALVTMGDEASAGSAFRAAKTIGLRLEGKQIRAFPAQA